MNTINKELFVIPVLLIILTSINIYYGESLSSEKTGLDKLTKKKQVIIQSWGNEHRYKLQRKSDVGIISKLNP